MFLLKRLAMFILKDELRHQYIHVDDLRRYSHAVELIQPRPVLDAVEFLSACPKPTIIELNRHRSKSNRFDARSRASADFCLRMVTMYSAGFLKELEDKQTNPKAKRLFNELNKHLREQYYKPLAEEIRQWG